MRLFMMGTFIIMIIVGAWSFDVWYEFQFECRR